MGKRLNDDTAHQLTNDISEFSQFEWYKDHYRGTDVPLCNGCSSLQCRIQGGAVWGTFLPKRLWVPVEWGPFDINVLLFGGYRSRNRDLKIL